MTAHRKYRYRLYPTPRQEAVLLAAMEAHRRLWNALLGIVHDAIKETVAPRLKREQVAARAAELGLPAGDVARDDGLRWRKEVLALLKDRKWTDAGLRELFRERTRELRKSDEHIGKVSANVLDAVVMSLVKSWSAYRAAVRGAKAPRFKRFGDTVGVAASRSGLFWLRDDAVEVSSIELDGERCALRFVKHREMPSTPKSAGIVREGGRWFVWFGVEVADAPSGPHPGPALGIDRGVRAMLADSTGRTVPGLADSVSFERRKLKLERSIARKVKGSSNWLKAQAKLLKHSQRRSDRRDDVLHKESARYAQTFGTIVVERLAITQMTKSAKGTAEEPGKNVRAKAGLNRSILAQGWGRFVDYLKYKSAQRGGVVLDVEPRNSSRTCAECGCVDADSRDGARFDCTACGHSADADVNAARIILARGVRGEVATSKKPSKKLHSVTGRTRAARTTTSPPETVANAGAGLALKQPVEDRAALAPDEAGRDASPEKKIVSRTSRKPPLGQAPRQQVLDWGAETRTDSNGLPAGHARGGAS